MNITDLDCIYLTYDEPQKEEFWVKIKNTVPWAKRVDGVKGSDAAHKAAAAASSTDRFILIDGDNLPIEEFFSERLILNDGNKDCVFRWRARNEINGLVYGNGGISCWTRDYINNMRTHENTDGRNETVVEFCFDPKYLPMHNCYSTTYPNGTPFQAWRAGFREGVKMALDRGRRTSMAEFLNMRRYQNIEYLSIWHNIGADVENGWWATYGARLGTYLTLLDESWDYTEVQDFNALKYIFKKVDSIAETTRQKHYDRISNDLKEKLQLPIMEMDANQSAFFKKFYTRLHQNKGIMDR
jgi:hypothetical protein